MTPEQVKELVERLNSTERTAHDARALMRDAASALSLLAKEREELREALKPFVRYRKSIEADIASAHRDRGNGASEWMREDDRDLRNDLGVAFDRARAALKEGS